MAVSMDVIKRVVIQGSSQGLDKLEGELRKIASSSDDVTVSFEKASRSQISAEAAYKRLSSSIDPAYRAQQQIEKGTNTLNRALQQGAIDQGEYTKRLNQLKSKYAEVASVNDNVVNGSKLQRYELVNLGRQIQDIGVSLHSGQSPFTVIVQQGSQVFDIFTSTKATFKGMAAQFLALVTPVSVLTTAFVGMTAAGVVAALQWGSAQKAIQLALAGAGRASGATSGGINALGAAPGFSISETRAFATELVKTGKIGADAIAGIVEVGHDVATVLGTDAVEAAKTLAKTFSDPINGSKELNQSLGFLDAATLRQITNLTEQNKLGEAHAVLLEKIKESTKGVTEAVGTSTKFWEALGNTISDWWNNFGAWASRATGIGFVQGLDEQIESTKKKIEELKRESASFQSLPEIGYVAGSTSSIAQLSAEEDKLKKLEEAWKRYQESVKEAQDRRDSLALSSAIESASPEITELDKLNNKYILLQNALNKVVETGVEASPVLKALGVTFSQLTEAVERAGNSVINYKTQSQQAIEGLQAQISGIGKRSPEALGQQAYEETIRRLGNTDEAIAQARLSRTLAQKQAEQGIIDSRNQQNLSAQQSVEKAQLELSLIGQTVGVQEAARAKLQAKQQLEQEALRIYGDRNAYDKNHLAELEKQADVEGKIKDIVAKTQLDKDIAFEKSTVFLSSIDQQIAQRLRPTHGDNVEVSLKSTEAAELRQIEVMKQMKDAATSFVESFVSGLAKGQSLIESLKGAVQGLGSQLISMGSKDLVGSLFRGVGANGQQTGGLLGGGLTNLLGMTGSMAGPIGGLLATGAGMLLTTLFNDKNDEATAKQTQQLQEAQRVWKEAGPSFTRFINEMTGLGTGGDLSSKFQSVASNLKQIFKDAAAAYDFGAIAKAASASIHYQITQSQQFLATWNSAISGFQSGGGVLKATDAVKSELDRVLAFLDDTRTAMNILAGSSDYGATADLANAAGLQWIADGMNAARDAGKSYLLSLVDNKSAMSDVAKQLAEVTATADAVRAALVSLNVSADDAAAAVNDRLASALSGMASAFNTTLIEEINNLSGRGWANDASALLKDYQQKLADAALIGGDSDLVTRWFKLSAQNIVDGARLTGSAFNELITQFPELQGVVTAFVEAAKDAADRIKSYQDQLFIAQQDDQTLMGALAIFDLQAQREREQEIAAGGQALAALEALQAQKRLNIIEDFNKKALDEAQRAADEQKRIRERELEERKREIEQTIEQNKRFVESLREFKDSLALDSLSTLSPYQKLLEAQSQFRQTAVAAGTGDTAAQGRLESIARTYLSSARDYYGSGQGYTSIYQSVNATLDGVLSNAEAQLSDAQRQLEQLELQTNALNTIASNTAALVSLMSGGGAQEPSWVTQLPSIPGYADGTNFHAGGMALVGERGPEIVNLPRGSQVRPVSNNDNDHIAALLERIIDVLTATGRMNVTESARTANAVQNLSRRLSSKELSRIKAS